MTCGIRDYWYLIITQLYGGRTITEHLLHYCILFHFVISLLGKDSNIVILLLIPINHVTFFFALRIQESVDAVYSVTSQ